LCGTPEVIAKLKLLTPTHQRKQRTPGGQEEANTGPQTSSRVSQSGIFYLPFFHMSVPCAIPPSHLVFFVTILFMSLRPDKQQTFLVNVPTRLL
jgi:hypothetical protein